MPHAGPIARANALQSAAPKLRAASPWRGITRNEKNTGNDESHRASSGRLGSSGVFLVALGKQGNQFRSLLRYWLVVRVASEELVGILPVWFRALASEPFGLVLVIYFSLACNPLDEILWLLCGFGHGAAPEGASLWRRHRRSRLAAIRAPLVAM